MIYLKKQGKGTGEIAGATAFSAYWVRTLVHRYNEGGAEGLRDRRHDHLGAAPLHNQVQQAELDRVLEHEKPPDGGR